MSDVKTTAEIRKAAVLLALDGIATANNKAASLTQQIACHIFNEHADMMDARSNSDPVKPLDVYVTALLSANARKPVTDLHNRLTTRFIGDAPKFNKDKGRTDTFLRAQAEHKARKALIRRALVCTLALHKVGVVAANWDNKAQCFYVPASALIVKGATPYAILATMVANKSSVLLDNKAYGVMVPNDEGTMSPQTVRASVDAVRAAIIPETARNAQQTATGTATQGKDEKSNVLPEVTAVAFNKAAKGKPFQELVVFAHNAYVLAAKDTTVTLNRSSFEDKQWNALRTIAQAFLKMEADATQEKNGSKAAAA